MQENPSPAAPPPKLRWYQYRLRTLLIVMTLLAVFFSWFGNRLRVAQLQRAAVAEIERDKSPDRYSFVSYEKKPKMPSWIERMAGEDFCYDVSAIILAKPGKKQLAALDDIPKF